MPGQRDAFCVKAQLSVVKDHRKVVVTNKGNSLFSSHGLHIRSSYLFKRRIAYNPSVFKEYAPLAKAACGVQIMRHQDYGFFLVSEFEYFFDTFFLVLGVTDGKGVVDYYDIGIYVYGQAESQPDEHTLGQTVTGCVNKLTEARKFGYFVKLRVYLFFFQPEERSVQINVLPAGQFMLETGPEIEQPRNPPVYENIALVRLQYAGYQF